MRQDDYISDRYADVISLLVLWHRLESSTHWLGYPPESPSCRPYTASRQYDDENGAFETHDRGVMAARVGHAVMAMEEPYRTALCLLARNRATGAAVWSSPRLPASEWDRSIILADALARLVDVV